MKILVTNNTFANLGGSETYAYTFIKELHRRGHDVAGFSHQLGFVASVLNSEAINVTTNPFLLGFFDVIFASHTSTIPLVRKYDDTKIIQTCHGIYPSLEQPHKDADEYVAISKEVHDHINNINPDYKTSLIHNGVDCERFNSTTDINKNLKTVLSLAQNDELNNMLSNVCTKLGIKFSAYNKHRNPIFDVEKAINQADLVVSLGRGAYEAMACGRNVLVLDKRNYMTESALGDGLLTIDNVDDIMYNNCSGRYSKQVYDEKAIENELLKYDPKHGKDLREYTNEYLNIITQTEKYLNLV